MAHKKSEPADNFSVVRIEGARVKPAGDKMAIIMSGYILLKAGAAVGSKLDPATLFTDRL